MSVFAWILFIALTLLSTFASIVLAKSFDAKSAAETAIVGFISFWGMIVWPIFFLGYLNHLGSGWVALLSAGTSLGVLTFAAVRSSLSAVARQIAQGLLDSLKCPFVAIKECWQSGSFSALGAIAALAAIGATLVLSYFVPADESWDGLYYHQPIIGFALQNHGFALVELPNSLLAQTINGYPKLGEAFSLWFVLFTDKTLIEVGNSLAAPGLVLATCALARRYSSDRVACIGWSSVILLMPAMYSQLRTTMVDVQLWFFYLSAVFFMTKRVSRLRDLFVAFVACAFVVGIKSTGLVLVPPLVLVALFRSLPLTSRRSRALCIGSGLALVATVAALTFGRNFLAYGNPFWPISYANHWLGMDFRGLAAIKQLSPDPELSQFLAREYEHPSGGVHDIIFRSYGNAVPWLIAPLGIVSLLFLLLQVSRGVAQKLRDPVAENLLLVSAVLLAPLALSPSFANARYNLQAVVAAILVILWLSEKRALPRLREGAVAASIVLSLMSAVWSDYLWGLGLTWRDLTALVAHSKAERRSMNFSSVQMPPDVAARRELELGAGAVAAFTADLTFIGVLWNDEFSNRVVYVPWTDAVGFLRNLEQTQTHWVAVGARSAARRALERDQRFELVGIATRQDDTVIFRRRRS